MKIEPLGVQRDRQIAELRGEHCKFMGNVAACMANCIECRNPTYKPYSTSIANAMELLDDMRYEYAEIEITHIRVDEEWLIRPFKEDGDVNDDNFEFEVREPTLQGAISGAWLRHKGGDNG